MRPPVLFGLFAGLDTIQGVGPKSLKLFQKLCGNTILSALFHLPLMVIDRTKPPFITTKVTVLSHEKPRSRKQPYKIHCQTESGLLDIVFFNYRKDYIIDQLPENAVRIISGQVSTFSGRTQMTHPDYITEEKNKDQIPLIEPVYPLTQGITNKMVQRILKTALKCIPDLPEWQDEAFLKQQKGPSFKESLLQVHHPQKDSDVSPMHPARMRLAYDELLANQLALALVRQKMRKLKGIALPGNGQLVQKLLKNLPFELTAAQKRSFGEIETDMGAPFRMMRLLQGDVGSGKTIVGLMAMLKAVESGYQACLMAPTDILVRQHEATLRKWCDPLGISVVLLTGREKGEKRREILHKMADGSAQIIVGTHALFQENVQFCKLGLVLIDEQHRFGVDQRLALTQKGERVDVLVMTATPIPRTLALTYYGDMDISKIDEKPPTRKPIDTRVLPVSKMEETIQKLHHALAGGAQVYWVCPLIEETEKSDLANATQRFETLEKAFPGRVALIHGKMKGPQKDALMQDFIDKKTDILVATTVIEVGVDVPSASIMIIEQAERFGLSQLHQLRGRIGRGSAQSVCLLLYQAPLSPTAKKRLDVMRKTEDGFLIAEEDLKLRGAGEVLGTRQSGLQSFKLADLEFHAPLLAIARDDAKLILNQDASLSSPRGMALKNLLYLFNKDNEVKTIHSG